MDDIKDVRLQEPGQFVQIATGLSKDGFELFALDNEGAVWQYAQFTNPAQWEHLTNYRKEK